ncbi:MAG: secondary thiamine-phosphate synthase enzyme YjbQ [Verrucomicrobiae bacterium]|nr:secondary thiamine-phosphate synthase enzyme YjbQ [Verrucomicrobiae bacterium]
MKELIVHTGRRDELVNITAEVQKAVAELGVRDGVCTVFAPHTTAGVTINENADPEVVSDILSALDKTVPWTAPYYRHTEGNAAAHVKASLVGSSLQVIVRNGRLQLGTWQAIYFCEFDGPRTRRVWVTVR